MTSQHQQLTILGTPIPQGSKTAVNMGGRAVIFDSNKKLKPWREQMKQEMASGMQPVTGPIHLSLLFSFTRPRLHFGTGRNAEKIKPQYLNAPMEKKPDIDKLVRAVLDSLTQSGVIEDDAKVVALVTGKQFADWEGVKIGLSALQSSGDVQVAVDRADADDILPPWARG